jgi:CubicO group peptidase (beta-lactamase class C family)
MIAMIGVVARILLCVFVAAGLGRSAVADVVFPGAHWESVDPASAGWSADGLAAAEAYARQIDSSAVMIVQDGRVVASWGKPDAKLFVHSIRKSLLSALYGQAVAEKRIDLGRTLADLGIDDKPPALSAAEKQATVRHLLMARSGVYHPAASETKRMKERRPQRGSHAPGSFWYYNNWDFNTLGTIYQRATGQDVFSALERRVAKPIGMEDFSARDGKFRYEPSSDHPAYTMALSARDLARFGWLYLNQGRWGDRQIVPMDWVAESTRPYSDAVPGPSPRAVRAVSMFWSRPPTGWWWFISMRHGAGPRNSAARSLARCSGSSWRRRRRRTGAERGTGLRFDAASRADGGGFGVILLCGTARHGTNAGAR